MSYVLVVDDEAGFREVLKRILEGAGYDVRVAVDAQDALGVLSEAPAAIAFCDIHMPGHDGLWLSRQIRASFPQTAVVLCTSDDTVPPIESMRQGMIAYVLKPFRRPQILDAVAAADIWHTQQTGQPIPRRAPVAMPEPEMVPSRPPANPVSPPHRSIARERRSISKRWIAVAGLVVAAIGGIAIYQRMTKPARVLQQIAAATGLIEVSLATGEPVSQGSGFFVAPDLFVTNHHVVRHGTKAAVLVAGGARVGVEGVVAFDRRRDLVILKTTSPSAATLRLKVATPAVGDEIFVYGAPRGLQGALSKGIVSVAPDGIDGLMHISAPLSPGSSGSPVTDTNGDVIGVATAVRTDAQGLNLAVPAAHVSEMVTMSAGAPRPLIATARGAGDDLERHQLVGDVRMVTEFATERSSAEPFPIAARVSPAMRSIDAATRAATVALQNSKTALLFHREGRLLQKVLGDDLTRSDYEYDERGRLKLVTAWAGNTQTERWEFAETRPGVFEATRTDASGIWRRRVEYDKEGRVTEEEERNPEGARTGTQWTYGPEGWPAGDAGRPAPDAPAAGSRSEFDAVGNLVRQSRPDGTVLTVEYSFDSRGNWLTRDITRVDPQGVHAVVSRQRREIQYWSSAGSR